MSKAGRPRLELIAAVAANGVIGRAGTLPWHLPDDLKHFKTLTMGHPILMGRRTWESIGRPLPGRTSIVISRSMTEPPHPEVVVSQSLDDALAAAGGAERVFVIGGNQLYQAAMPQADVLHLTELDEPVEGDTFFPPWNRQDWRLVSDLPHPRDDRHACGFHFRTFERR